MIHTNTRGLRTVAATLFALSMVLAGCADDAKDAETPTAYITKENRLAAADELAIRQVLARMNHSVDAQTWDQYVTFYAENAVLDTGFAGVAEGHEAIRALMEMMAPYISTKRHVASNIVVNGEGDRATAISYLTIFEREEALRIDGLAVITDEFQRQADGRWIIVRHTTVPDPATFPDEQP